MAIKSSAYATKGEFWLLLGSDAIPLSAWLVTDRTYAPSIKFMLENTDGISMDSDMMQHQ
jgi:hypothetical protein